MKRTKIVATIGPASESVETLKQMIKAGMNVARLNFSHGTHVWHSHAITKIRSASKKLNQPVAIIQDLSGPKLRLGEFKDRVLKNGEHVVLGNGGIPVMRHIWEWIKAGQTILIDDGLVELMATKIHADCVEAKVVVGGKVISHKGVNLPGIKVNLPALSEKDLADLEFGLKHGVDYVAQSFVKTAADILQLKKIIKKIAKKDVPVIAKIETVEALKNLYKIIDAADAVMVARGDLALNMPQESEAVAQKNIVKRCVYVGKPVIMATQMLESMSKNPRPTRAEISDVANAVIDHVDAVMLSGESAFGQYPLKTVETMAGIITQTEKSPWDDYKHLERSIDFSDRQLVLAHNLVHFAVHSKAAVIVVPNLKLAAYIARFRPELKIILVSKYTVELARASLLWGVMPVHASGSVANLLKHHGLLERGQRYLDATAVRLSASIMSMN